MKDPLHTFLVQNSCYSCTHLSGRGLVFISKSGRKNFALYINTSIRPNSRYSYTYTCIRGRTLILHAHNYDVDLTFIPTQISNSEHGLYIHKYLIRYTHISDDRTLGLCIHTSFRQLGYLCTKTRVA